MDKQDEMWGMDVMKLGWVTVPSLLIQHQARIGVTALEMAVLLHIFQYWWQANKLPFPGNARLAAQLGISPRQVQRHIAALEKKGLIKRHARNSPTYGQVSNFLDPSGLVSRLQELQRTLPRRRGRSSLPRKRPDATFHGLRPGLPGSLGQRPAPRRGPAEQLSTSRAGKEPALRRDPTAGVRPHTLRNGWSGVTSSSADRAFDGCQPRQRVRATRPATLLRQILSHHDLGSRYRDMA